jgi:hypothetical protein
MYPVSRFEFHKDYVIYVSVVNGDAYCTFHKRIGLSDDQAKKMFHVEHSGEVHSMVIEKKIKDEQQNRGKLIAV